MMDFEVQRCTRHCAETEREFEPGEPFFSALVQEEAEIVRKDFCTDAWDGPPEETVGWWKSQMPDPKANRMNWAPSDVMLDYFERLENDATRGDVRYILALLMVRRRILRLEDPLDDEDQENQLTVYSAKREKQFQVSIVTPTSARVEEIQNELAALLFSDAA
ncbi:MAG: hypothetical protein COA78_17865 [Blastopirellula sp.]|nr:MAG: hypothetical protein COA78_17865 [Blastopirellula sp.]